MSKTRVLGKTEAIRKIFRKVGRPLKIDDLRNRLESLLRQVVGRADLYALLASMKKAKEIDTVGRGDDCWYHLLARKAKA